MNFSATVILLLLCVRICVTNTAGSYDYGHLLHKRQDKRCDQVAEREFCTDNAQDAVLGLLQCNLQGAAISIRDDCQGLSSIDLPEVEIDPTCNQFNFLEQLLPNVLCTRRSVASLLDALASEDCQEDPVFDMITDRCNADEAGRYCDTLPRSNRLILEAQNTCNDTSVCDPLCIGTLTNLSNTNGCCFNEEFNRTYSQPDFLSFEFWSQCNLTSPGFCEPLLTDGTTTANHAAAHLRAQGKTTLLFSMMVLVLLYKLQ